MQDVFVVGVGMTPFGRHPDLSYKELTRRSVSAAADDAGAELDDIEQAMFGSCVVGSLHGQQMVPGQMALHDMGIEGIPIFNLENACASASSAMLLGYQAIKAGSSDVVLAVGTEKMFVEDRAQMMAVFDGAWDVETVEENERNVLAIGHGVEPPDGSQSERPYSRFMDVYAALARQHMATFGTTQRQIAEVSAKNHRHSVENPVCQYRTPYTADEILAAPPITYPLTLPMCSPISDGSAAVVLASAEGMKRIGGNSERAVQVLASVAGSASRRDPSDFRNHITAVAAAKAYEQAGVEPGDVDVAEVHDATAVGEIIQVENLGLVPFGEGGPAAERGDLEIGGRMPVNPSGGLESRGHPIGATGLAQVNELVTQLRGEAGPRQVEGARIAIQENGGGFSGIEEAAAVVSIFATAS